MELIHWPEYSHLSVRIANGFDGTPFKHCLNIKTSACPNIWTDGCTSLGGRGDLISQKLAEK